MNDKCECGHAHDEHRESAHGPMPCRAYEYHGDGVHGEPCKCRDCDCPSCKAGEER